MDNMEEKKENLIQVDLREIMETSFLDYSMSVIVQRALPDVRDGLKPLWGGVGGRGGVAVKGRSPAVFSTPCMKTLCGRKRLTESARIPSVPYWAATIRTAMLRFMTRWCVLRRIFPCAICSLTATATSVP